jgi:hypothetical protein
MEKELKNVVWEKYMDSDIDSVVLFFEARTDNSVVGEFDVPDEEMHMVFYSQRKDNGMWNWVEIVNPQEVAKQKNVTLPNISVKVEGNVYGLKELIEKLVDRK